MSRRYRRRRDNLEDAILDLLEPLIGILILGLIGWVLIHPKQAELYGIIGLVVIIVAVILYFVHDRWIFNAFNVFLYLYQGPHPRFKGS
jgi:uncharacterized membrane protein